jgi:hypothetical protein
MPHAHLCSIASLDAGGPAAAAQAALAAAAAAAAVEREVADAASAVRVSATNTARDLAVDTDAKAAGVALERLDALQALLWPLAEAGDTRAAASVVRIVEQRVRLLGLDLHSASAITEINSLATMEATQEAQPPRIPS